MSEDARSYLQNLLSLHQTAPRDVARLALLAEPGRLYALVDVALDPELLDVLDASGEEYCAVDETRERDDLGATAPVLVEITPGAPTLATLLEEAWAVGAVVFVSSDETFREVYRHVLARTGVDPSSTAVPFWNPSALRAVLESPDRDGQRLLFGPITAFMVEATHPDALLRYALTEQGVARAEFPLR